MHNDKSKTVYSLVAIIIGMVCLVIASVPLYNLFCKVTGFSGTANSQPSTFLGTKQYKILFNADKDVNLEWEFKPLQRSIDLTTGENKLALYEVVNKSDKPIKAIAVYNVMPSRAALYFNKIECFCYDEKIIPPQKTIKLPISFFIDPEIEKDPLLKDLKQITLSYSFLQSK